MKKEELSHHRFRSITEAHRFFGLPKPRHPLISMVGPGLPAVQVTMPAHSHVLSFYKIAFKPRLGGKVRYGQHYYDFDEGGLLFAAPNQIIGKDEDTVDLCGQTLLIHPDFLLGYPLAKKIKQYGFFFYATHEALHLSDQEKDTVLAVFRFIGEELGSRLDDFSQDVLVAQVELLLSYAERFYKRQFLTRKAVSHELLQSLEALLDDYFSGEASLQQGIPTVQYLSGQLHLSPSYLSDMLRSLTGQNAQQHIHQKLLEKAKEKLSTTNLTVSEVAYELGFGHPQSFSKFFKTKMNLSPLAFRRSFQ